MPSRISDAFRTHPVHLLQKQHLDFDTVNELPDSYAWTQLEHGCSCSLTAGLEEGLVPVIDLHCRDAVVLIGDACRTWGVFQVTNHGVPDGLLHRIKSEARKLFSLPLEQKLTVARPPDGVSGYGVARISCFFQKLMWSEGFTIVGSPLKHARQLWPNDYTEFWYSQSTCMIFTSISSGPIKAGPATLVLFNYKC